MNYVLIISLVLFVVIVIGLIVVMLSYKEATSFERIIGKVKNKINNTNFKNKNYASLRYEDKKSGFNKNDEYIIDLVSELSDLMEKLDL